MERRSESDPYKRLFETMLDGAVVVEAATGQIVLANQAAAMMFGFSSPEEMAGQNPLNYVPPEDRDQVARMMADSFQKVRGAPTEIRIRTNQGRLLWVSASVSLIDYEGKKATLTTVRDITSEKAKDAALREAEQQYQHVFDGMIDGAAVLDISTFRIVLANKSAAEMFGFESPRDIVGEDPLAYIPEEDRDEVARMIALNLEGKGKNPVEIRVNTRDKRQIWVSANASKIEYEGRTATLTTLRDMTADKAKDAALEAAERSRMQLLDAASESIFIVQDEKFVYVNPAGARAAGLSQEQMTGRSILDFVHPDDKQTIVERYKKVTGGQLTAGPATVKGMDASGQPRWTEIQDIAFSWRGKPAIMTLVTDITDRVRLEDERKEREERLHAIIENAWDGVTILDENYHTIFESPSLARISGYTPEEWLGRTPDQMLIHPDDLPPLLARIETLKSQPGSVISDVTIRYRHKDGSWRWIEATGHNLLHDPKVKGLVINYRDITEKVKAEQVLKEQEERLRTIVDNAWDGVAIFDEDYNVQFESPTLSRMTGYTPQEWKGTSPALWPIHPDDMLSLLTNLEDLKSRPGSTATGVTMRFRHKNGSWRTIEASGRNLLQDPRVKGIVINFHDTTENVKAQEAVKASEERFRTLIEKATDVVVVLDANGKTIYQSPSLQRVTGYEPHEWLDRSLTDFVIHPEDVPPLAAALEQILAQPGAAFEGVCARYRHKDGSWHVLEATVTNMLHDPKVNGIVANFRDITERQASKTALTESERKFRLLVENANDLIFSLDAEGNFTYVSPAIERISGFRVDEVIGTSFVRFVFPEDLPGLMASFERTLGGASEPFEFRGVMKDGAVRWVRTASRVTQRDGQVVGVTGVMSDVTERREAEEALKRSEALLRDTQQLARVGGWEYDVESDKALWTDETYRIHEIPKIPTIDHVAESLKCYPPEDRQTIALAFQKCLEEGTPYDLELPFVTFKGNRRWVRTTARAVREGDRTVRVLGNVADVTERRRIEEALRSSEERNRAIVESANEAVAVIQDGVIKFVNPRLAEVTGYSADELHLKPYLELVHPDDRQMAADRNPERAKGEDIHRNYELRFLDKNGNAGWAEMSTTLFEWDGRPATLCLMYDITARRQAEEALRASEERNRTIVENANEAIAVIQDGLIKLANPKFALATGYTINELILRPFVGLIHPDDQPMAVDIYIKRQKGEDVPYSYPFRFIDKAGNVGWAEINATLFEWGGQTATLALITDITERKRAEEALHEAKEYAENVIQTANVLVVALDNEGRVTLLNQAGEKITGYKQNEVLGKGWFELIVPKERYPHVWEAFGKVKAAGSIIDTFENPILTKAGEERIVSWKNSTLVLNGEVAGTLSFGTDITERKRAEKTLQESEEKFRLLTEKTNDLIWMTDVNLVTIYASPSAERLLGFRPEELLKLSPDSLMTPESFGRAQETLLKQLDLERGAGTDPQRSVTLELEYCRKDGSTVWLENRISGIRDADGRLIGLHGVARDISERRKAEQALRDSEAIYKRLFENTQTAMEVVSGETGLVVLANESTARMFGFASADDLIGADSLKYLLPEDRDRVAGQIAQALVDKDWSRGTELSVGMKDGRRLWIHGLVTNTEYKGKPALLISLIDLTSRKQAEEQLKESEEKFRRLTEKTNDLVYTTDLNLNDTYVSPSVERILGFTPEEHLARDAAQQLTPESLARAQKALLDHLAQEGKPDVDPNRTLRIELEYYRKDGSTVWLEHQISGIRDASGTVVALHGVARDVTERRRADQVLRESEKKHRLLTERTNDVVWTSDINLRGTYISPSAERILGFTPEERLKQNVTQQMTPESFARAAEALTHQLELERDPNADPNRILRIELEYYRKDGSTIWLEDQISGIRDEHGTLVGLYGVARDMSERRRVEQALRESEEKYRLLAEKTNDVIWTADLNLRTTYVSPSIERVLGFTPEERLKQDATLQMTPESLDRAAKALADHLAMERDPDADPNRTLRIELEYYHKDGSTVWLENQVSGIRDASGKLIGFHGVGRDIGERRKVEQALRASEEKYRLVAESTNDEIWTSDINLNTTYVSPSVKRILGFTPEERMKQDIMDQMTPESFARAAEALAHHLALEEDPNADPNRMLRIELEYYRKDGSTVWLENQVGGIRDARGTLIGFHGVARDVTERRRAEQALKESEERYRLLAENASDIIWVTNADLKVTYASPSATSLLGYPLDELSARSFDSLLTPDSVAAMTGVYKDALALEKTTPGSMKDVTTQIEVRRKSGSTVWLEAAVNVIRDKQGRFAGFQGACRDITERRRAQQALKESEERFRTLIEQSTDAIAILDSSGNLLYESPSMERITGYRLEDWMGKPLGDWLIHQDDMGILATSLERVLGEPNATMENLTARFKHKDGTWHILEATVRNLLHDPKVGGLVINYRDVTQRKQAEEALTRKTKELDGFFSVALDLLCIADTDGRFHLLNRAWEPALGFTREELMAGRFFDFVHPDDVKSTEEAVARLASGQEVVNFINRYSCRDGSYRWLEWRSAPYGNMIYAAARDITEQRKTLEALAASETRYKDLFDHTLLGMEVIDAQTGKVVLANHALSRMFGFKSPADMVGTSPMDYVLPEDLEWVPQRMAQVLADPNDHKVINIRAKTEDGRIIWVTASGTSFQHDGKPSMLLSLIDVTAAKEAEAKLHEEEKKNRLLIDSAAEGIAVIQDGLIRFVNPKCTEFAGRPVEEMISMPFLEMVHPDDRQMLAENYARRLGGGDATNNYQFRVVDKQGNTKWLQINAAPLEWEGKPATLAMLNDITDRVKALEALATSEAKYRALFEHTLLGMEVVDGQTGETVLANRSLARMFGFKSPADMIGTKPLDYVLPEDLEWVAKQIAELMADPSWDKKAVIRTRTDDGRLIWVTGMTTPFEYEGKPAMLISLVDTTAAKESELKLHESEEKNRLLIDNAAEAIVVLQDGLVKFVNPKGAELVGRVSDEMTPTPFANFVHSDDRQMIMDNHAKRLTGEEGPNNYTFRMIGEDGNMRWIQINAVRFDWEGKPAVLAMLNDITERVQAQEALAASEANYRDLFEHTMVGMEVVDTETMKVVLANHSMARMFGFKSPEEMVGTEPLSYVLPEDLDWVVADLAKALADPTKKETATLRARTQDGRIIWVTGMTTRFQYVFRPSLLISLVDVTAVKEADLKLQESEEKNRLLIDNAAEAIVVVQDGMTKFFNRRLAELTGWPPEQLFAKSFLDLVHPDDRELVALNYMKRVSGEDVANNYQFRIVDSQNNTRWFQVNAVRLNWDGKPATMTMFGDVTERVKAEQAVRDSEERFRALIEKATDAIAIIDAQGKIIYYSPSIERATGYESQGWLSRSMADWKLHPDDLAALAPVFDEILKNPGKITEGLKVRYEHPDGTWHTLEATVRNLLHDPKINGLVANFRDVTERVKGEELLRNSEERFRGLVETSSDWVWEVDRNTKYTYVSPKVRDILGYEPEEILGHTPFDFMHQREARRVSRIMRRFAAEHLPFSLLENTSTHKDGRSVVLETSAVPIMSTDGDFLGYRGIDRDITERKKVEQELQRSLKRLEKTMESTIEAITTTIETRDPYTTGHQMRVTDLACTIAKVMEVPPTQIEGIRVAGLLHDIGKIAIPTEILSKPGKLNEVEYEMIKTHAKVGYNILKKIEFPWPVAKAVLQHHERWNGSGYPHGLRGEDILLEARILAVADVMEAMSSHRPYRPSIGGDKALDEIVTNSGVLYDPAVARACVKAFTEAGFKFTSAQPGAPAESETASSDRPAHLRENN